MDRYFLVFLFFCVSLYSHEIKAYNWNYKVENDAMTDKLIQTASVISEDGNGSLKVRCIEGSELNILVSFGKHEYLGNHVFKSRYRVDKSPLVEIESQASTEGTSAFIVDYYVIDFIKNITNGNKVIIEVTDYKKSPRRIEFSLNSAAENINKLIKKCPSGVEKVIESKEYYANSIEEYKLSSLMLPIRLFEVSANGFFERSFIRNKANKKQRGKSCTISFRFPASTQLQIDRQGDGSICELADAAIDYGIKSLSLSKSTLPDVFHYSYRFYLTDDLKPKADLKTERLSK